MKSTSHGIVDVAHQVGRKKTAPFSTPTSSRSRALVVARDLLRRARATRLLQLVGAGPGSRRSRARSCGGGTHESVPAAAALARSAAAADPQHRRDRRRARPSPTSQRRAAAAASASDLVDARRRPAGTSAPAASSAEPRDDQPRAAPAAARAGARRRSGRAPSSSSSTSPSSTSASSRSSCGGAQHVRLGRRMRPPQRGHEPVAHARRARSARPSLLASSRQREPARAAVGRRLLAGHAEQRPHEPAVARRHAQQRPPAGRGGEPVEDRLDLVAAPCARPRRRRRARPRARRAAA